MKATWEKILEYASMPVHGTMSRKLRKGVTLQINEGQGEPTPAYTNLMDGEFAFYGDQLLGLILGFTESHGR